ncbi:protein of unknown function (plasmid) [Cupriavidus taiwanensis]|uniref:Transposase IS66 C-terminal domain-containing protein n=1 Tax=Cupriavidus taiwanensis TaxID=164546 RepID=A0A375I8P7_9BURK|nr:hypothetical protein CT19425_U580009 [Cupriavidus taiwanensis]SPK77524.1 protein of unknown function [Cupriavidus taiwanensis]
MHERKNWLFCDTVAGAKASANLYPFIETARTNGIDPYRYLVHCVIEMAPDEFVAMDRRTSI